MPNAPDAFTAIAEQHLARFAGDAKPSIRDESTKFLEDLLTARNKHVAAMAAIAGDGDLTADAKRRRHGEAVAAFGAQVRERVAALSGGLETKAAALMESVRQRTVPANDFAALRAEVRYDTIRRSVADLDKTRLELLYRSAPMEVKEALRTAPARFVNDDRGARFEPFISDEVVAANLEVGTIVEQGNLKSLRERSGAYRAVGAALLRLEGVRDPKGDEAHNPLEVGA